MLISIIMLFCVCSKYLNVPKLPEIRQAFNKIFRHAFCDVAEFSRKMKLILK